MSSAAKSGRDSFPSISGTDRFWLVLNIKSLQRQRPHRPRHGRGRGSACAVALAQAGAEVSLAEALRAMLLELHKGRQANLGRAALRPPRRIRRTGFMGSFSKMDLRG